MQMDDIKVILGNIEYEEKRMSEELALYLVLQGNLQVEINGISSCFEGDTCFCVNVGDICEFRGVEANVTLGLRLENTFLNEQAPELMRYNFYCDDTQEEAYTLLKKGIADTAFAYLSQEENSRLLFRSFLYKTLSCLIQYFKKENRPGSIKRMIQNERLLPVLEYISQNYKNRITLKELAAREYISEQYLSRLFFKQMGMNLTEYLQRLRLEKSEKALLYTDKKITNIALEYGFSSAKAFSEQFKRKYGMLPRLYRKLNGHAATPKEKFFKNMELHMGESLAVLDRYLNPNNQMRERHDTVEVNVDMNQMAENSLGKCIRILNVGEMSRILRWDVRQQLQEASSKIKFQYVYFYHFFSRSMDLGGTFPIFRMTDHIEIFHLFRTLNLIPFFRFEVREFLQEPDEWSVSLKKLTELLMDIRHEYDDREFERWKFEIVGSSEELEMYYSRICEAINRAVRGAEIGVYINLDGKWRLQLMELKNFIGRVDADFLTMDVDLNQLPLSPESKGYADKCRYYIRQITNEVREELSCIKEKMKLYMMNWNVLTGKTSQEAGEFHRTALIADQLLQMSECLDGVGIALNLRNPYEKNTAAELYSYGLSLFYYKTVKRHLFFVTRFMDNFRNHIVFANNNMICTAEKGNAVVYTFFLYNPWYMNPFDSLDVIRNENYTCSYRVSCRNIIPGHYRVKKTVFNRDSGGIYNRLINVGNRTALNMEEYGEYLENSSYPDLMIYEQTIGSTFSFYQELPLNGIAFYVMKKTY